MSDRKDELADALSDIPVMYTKFTERESVMMNFESATDRELAVNKISTAMDGTETQLTRKVLPKIMICDVTHEKKQEDVIHYLISKNKYL